LSKHNSTRTSTQLYTDEYATVREKSAYSIRNYTPVNVVLVEKGLRVQKHLHRKTLKSLLKTTLLIRVIHAKKRILISTISNIRSCNTEYETRIQKALLIKKHNPQFMTQVYANVQWWPSEWSKCANAQGSFQFKGAKWSRVKVLNSCLCVKSKALQFFISIVYIPLSGNRSNRD